MGVLLILLSRPTGRWAAAKGIVVIVPDAFGWKLVNTRILADKYAERCQVTVYVPDFMDEMCMFEIRSLRYC